MPLPTQNPPAPPLSDSQVSEWIGHLANQTRSELRRRGYESELLNDGQLIDLLYSYHGAHLAVASRVIELGLLPRVDPRRVYG